MRGELDFEASLRERVRPARRARRRRARPGVRRRCELAPGARTLVRTLKRLGYRFAIVSGGFTQITDRLAADLGIDFAAANELEIVDGRLTGRHRRPGRRPGRQGRGAAPVRRARPASPRGPRSRSATAPTTSTCSRPPGSASRSTPSRSCSRPRDTAVNVPYLDAIMYLLGISREEVEAADALEGVTTPDRRSPCRSTARSRVSRGRRGSRRPGRSRRPSSAHGDADLEHGERPGGKPCSSSESAAGSPSPSSRQWHQVRRGRVVAHEHHAVGVRRYGSQRLEDHVRAAGEQRVVEATPPGPADSGGLGDGRPRSRRVRTAEETSA